MERAARDRDVTAMTVAPSASYSLTVRLEIHSRPGMLGRVTSAIGEAGGERRVGMDFMKSWIAQTTNPRNLKGKLLDAVERADIFIGLSVPGVLTVRDIKKMARDPIVFAMANPVPEIQPEEAERHVAVMATGRSDYPNQINNVLCFPGFFRGLLDCRAGTVNDEMKIAAARAIAACVEEDERSPEYIIPSVFSKKVAPALGREVARAAQKTGVARRVRRFEVASHF